ncbi:alpha/beta hydrolase [Ruminiclostridium herbifermentans]|uniref:Alpha/beta hydrolase n=1 Tax=Ruminiclostridium herbifermentans TaxID=2488810 RepID=A0A4U7JCX9_9FIRM|nr:alpha/beta hydrolase [Ruminiclostridium herbifermentans]QNU67868.1 alpha/beta hydrolase [Ruminiclostridium herbifermentans]
MFSNSCGYNLYYEISGNNKGEWLLLLHGIAGSTRCWKYQINDLNAHFKILNIDLAGHGNSGTLGTARYSGEIIANHIRILLDELNIDKTHILGLSLGTIIQQYFCEMFPERVISNVFTSPICKPNYLSYIMNSFADKIFLKLFSKNTYLDIMAYLMLPGKIHEKSRKFFLSETSKMSNEEFIKWWKVTVKGDHYFYTSNCSIPSLIIVGENDFCFYDDAVALKEKYTNSDFIVIKNAGHVLIFQKPEEFNSIVIDYINKQKNSTKMFIK